MVHLVQRKNLQRIYSLEKNVFSWKLIAIEVINLFWKVILGFCYTFIIHFRSKRNKSKQNKCYIIQSLRVYTNNISYLHSVQLRTNFFLLFCNNKVKDAQGEGWGIDPVKPKILFQSISIFSGELYWQGKYLNYFSQDLAANWPFSQKTLLFIHFHLVKLLN